MPTAARTALHSRSTARRMFSPGRGKVSRALPQADILEHGAAILCPCIDGRAAHGIEQIAATVAGECAEGHRRIGLTERRQADRGQRLVQRLGDDGERIHVAGLALVRCHARRRVALDVLDGAEAFLGGEAHILGRHVVLEIDEGFDGSGIAAMGPFRCDCAGQRWGVGDDDGGAGLDGVACCRCGGGTGGEAGCNCFAEIMRTRAGPGERSRAWDCPGRKACVSGS